MKSTKKKFAAQTANAFAKLGLKLLDKLSGVRSLFSGRRRRIWMENYRINTAIGIPAGTIINDQWSGTETGIDQCRFGKSDMKHTGCEVIAVSNALAKMEFPVGIADLVLDFQRTNSVFTFPFVAYGRGGSNPYSIGRVLTMLGQRYSKVNTMQDMRKKGVYILSFWNGTGALSLEGLHTIACQVYADGTVQPYNKKEVGRDEPVSFDTFASELEKGFITGYFLGRADEKKNRQRKER